MALAVAVVGHSLNHSFDHPHTHVPVAGEFAISSGKATIVASSTGSSGSTVVTPGTAELVWTGFAPTVTISKAH